MVILKNVYFFIGRLISSDRMVFNKLDNSLLFVFILDYHHCLTILQVPYSLHEDPKTLLAPTNQTRIECEKIQLNNSFESLLKKDVQYSVIVENITVGETRDMLKAFAMFLYFFIHIQFGVSEKLKTTILLILKLFL